MGYLNIPSSILPDFNEAVISLWFRVPQTTIDNCIALPLTPNLVNIIPLVTFGRPQVQLIYSGFALVNPIFALTYSIRPSPTVTGSIPADPSYIGLSCFTGSPNRATLTVNLQTGVTPIVTGYEEDLASAVLDPAGGSQYTIPGSGYIAVPGGGGGGEIVFTQVDNSFTQASPPGCYNITTSIPVTPDVWHQLIISFDITNGCVTSGTTSPVPAGISSFSKMWVALDDVNYNGNNLGAYGGGDPNMILTNLGFNVLNVTSSLNAANLFTPTATYSLTGAPIPSNAGPMGLPASAAFVENVVRVDMAELQIYTGVSMDTSVEANRRVFLGANGKPVDPFAVLAGSPTPIDPVAAAEAGTVVWKGQKLLGKAPDIALVGRSRNWMLGLNTGSLKHSGFGPNGTIKPFFPNPKLGS